MMDNRFDFFGEQLFEEAKYFLEKAKQEEEQSDKQTAFLHSCLLLGMSSLEAYVNSIAEELCMSFVLDVLTVGFIFDSSLSDTKFFSIFD